MSNTNFNIVIDNCRGDELQYNNEEDVVDIDIGDNSESEEEEEEEEVDGKKPVTKVRDRKETEVPMITNSIGRSAPGEVVDAAQTFEKNTQVHGVARLLLYGRGAALRRDGWTVLTVCDKQKKDSICCSPFLRYFFLSIPDRRQSSIVFVKPKTELGWALKYKTKVNT